jgi:hypothetical protein
MLFTKIVAIMAENEFARFDPDRSLSCAGIVRIL